MHLYSASILVVAMVYGAASIRKPPKDPLKCQAEGKGTSPPFDVDGLNGGDDNCGGETGEGVFEVSHWLRPW